MAAEGDIDVFVRETFFPGRKAGVLVEIGAAGPDYLSIGQSFRDLGWRVIAIEPNPEFCAAHLRRGHEVLQYACGERDEDDVPFTVIDSCGAEYMGGAVSFESFSSLGIRDSFANLRAKANYETLERTIQVKVRRLDTILSEHAPDIQRIDMLAVDVEGWEMEVMKGFSIKRFDPRVVILENLFADQRYTAYMQDAGYKLAAAFPPNEIYVPLKP